MTLSAKSAPQPTALYLALAGLVTLSMGVAIANLTHTFDHDSSVRYFGILMGGLMVVAGNALPKLLNPGATRNAERLAGWILVLGGLLIIGLWIWMPETSRIVTTSATGLGIFAVVLAITLWMTRGQFTTHTLSPEMRRAAINRKGLFHILHAVMWVFALFLASELWDKASLAWFSVAFAVALGVLNTWLSAPLCKPNIPAE